MAYSTPPLAIQVSGHVDVVLGVGLDGGRSEWVRVASSLLAGGYLGTMAVQADVTVDELIGKGCPFDELPGGLGPIALDDATLLAWGMFVWAYRRHLLGDGAGFVPGLGALAQPTGNPLDWERELSTLFFDHQLHLADQIASFLKEDIDVDDDAVPMDRADAPMIVSFRCKTERPLTLASELDRHPMEFVNDPKRNIYTFHPRESTRSVLAGYEDKKGFVRIRGQRLEAMTPSASDAAALAARLAEVASFPLELEEVVWVPPDQLGGPLEL